MLWLQISGRGRDFTSQIQSLRAQYSGATAYPMDGRISALSRLIMSKSEIHERVRLIMASVFGVEISSLEDNASPESIETWDSMGQLTLIMALEQEFEVEFTERQSASLRSLSLVVSTVAEALDQSSAGLKGYPPNA